MVTDKSYSFLPLLLLVLGSLGLHLYISSYYYDDAYIHLRIVRNFIESGVPYFNPADPVMGSSSPLWILALTLFFSIFQLTEQHLLILNSIITAGAIFIWTKITLKDLDKKSILLSTLIAIIYFSILWPASGGLMETPLALLLLGLGIFSFSRNSTLSFFFLTLAALTRIEFFVPLLLGLLIVIRNKKSFQISLIKTISTILITLSPFLLFLFYFYGTLVPQPVVAKSIVYAPTFSEFINLFFNQVIGEDLNVRSRLVAPIYLICIVCGILFVIFTKKRDQSRPIPFDSTILLTLLSALLIILAYALRTVLIFPWYVPLFLLPLVFSILRIALVYKRKAYLLLAVIISAPLILLPLLDLLAKLNGKDSVTNSLQGVRVKILKNIGSELYDQNKHATLLAPEIGALGFTFKSKIVDALGLISKESLYHHPLKIPEDRPSGLVGSIPLSLVLESQPDYIVSLKIFAAPLLSDLSSLSSLPDSNLKSEIKDLYTLREYQDPALKVWQSDRIIVLEKTMAHPLQK